MPLPVPGFLRRVFLWIAIPPAFHDSSAKAAFFPCRVSTHERVGCRPGRNCFKYRDDSEAGAAAPVPHRFNPGKTNLNALGE